jgi:F420-non-reducing hydrogenase iron-sulfur subunit
MCSGRVDPVMIVEAFIAGADGVLIGACKRGECHYSTGNLQAEAKLGLTRRILALAGLRPDRLVMRWMSSAEGNKFAEYVTAFQAEISQLGPVGQAEKVQQADLALRLEAARKALAGRKLRWVEGKIVEFTEKGNLYGERFTAHEIGRLCDEIAADEFRLREILERITLRPHSVRDLAAAMGVAPRIILRQMADLKRMGLAGVTVVKGRSPQWAAEKGTEYR